MKIRLNTPFFASLLFAGVFSACSSNSDTAEGVDQNGETGETGEGVEQEIDLPLGFPVPKVPKDNPITEEKAELGRYLFYDARLSGNEMQSCGSCHEQELAFSDGLVTAEGSTGAVLARNSSSLVNIAYNSTLTWANPVLTELEEQLLVPIFGEDPIELGAASHEEEILERLQEDALYPQLFAQAFPEETDPVTWPNIVKALSTFVRTLISGNSPFDRFVYHEEVDALSESARRGMVLFYSEELECHHCHGGFNFSESSQHEESEFDTARFHNTGLYNIAGTGDYPANNTGIYSVTGDPNDMGRFRPPTLRNIGLSAPYMHDGSMDTLEDVIRFYEAGGRLITEGPYAGDGRKSPFKSGFVAGFELSDEERQDLIAFLESLSDEDFISNPAFSDPFADSP